MDSIGQNAGAEQHTKQPGVPVPGCNEDNTRIFPFAFLEIIRLPGTKQLELDTADGTSDIFYAMYLVYVSLAL